MEEEEEKKTMPLDKGISADGNSGSEHPVDGDHYRSMRAIYKKNLVKWFLAKYPHAQCPCQFAVKLNALHVCSFLNLNEFDKCILYCSTSPPLDI